MNTTDALALLNTLRATAGKAPLKSWKASRASLDAAIDALSTTTTPVSRPTDVTPIADAEVFNDAKPAVVVAPAVAKGAYKTKRAAAIATGKAKLTPLGKAAKRSVKEKALDLAREAKANRQTKQASATKRPARLAHVAGAHNTFALVEVARELGINPKVARAKMRRRNDITRDGWTFANALRTKVTEALRGDNRKK